MKKTVLMVIIILPLFCYSQSAKKVRNNKISSQTITKTMTIDTLIITYVDTYEEFNKDGKTITEIKYDMSGVVRRKRAYKYDAFGNVIEELEYDQKKAKTVKRTFKHDAFGNEIEITTTDEDGKEFEKQTFTYDKNGLKITAIEYRPNGDIKWEKKYTYETR
ncbi:MAG: hypothetical protein PHE33_03320 [Bacteroidales bacterium]|nr:hypothetical protein [Bacteroidales bacterium]